MGPVDQGNDRQVRRAAAAHAPHAHLLLRRAVRVLRVRAAVRQPGRLPHRLRGGARLERARRLAALPRASRRHGLRRLRQRPQPALLQLPLRGQWQQARARGPSAADDGRVGVLCGRLLRVWLDGRSEYLLACACHRHCAAGFRVLHYLPECAQLPHRHL